MPGHETKQGLISNFANGEISPLYYGRVDTEFYQAAAKELTNGIVVESGAFIRRPGTKYSSAAYYASDTFMRLIPLPIGEDYYMVELSPDTMRFHKGGERVVDGAGDPIELATGWTEDIIKKLSYIAVDGELIIAWDGLHRVVRNSVTSWEIKDPDWLEKKTANGYTPPSIEYEKGSSGTVVLRGAIDLQYKAHSFSSTDVGQILYVKASGGKEGYCEITSYHDFKVEQREIEAVEGGTTTTEVRVPDNYVKYTYVDTTDPAVGNIAIGDTITEWGTQPWDPADFDPRTVAAIDGRIVCSGFSDEKRRIVGSAVGTKWIFRYGSTPDKGYEFTLKEDYGNEIVWLQGVNELMIGTDSGIYSVAKGESINPSVAFNLIKQSSFKASKIPPVWMGDTMAFVHRPGTGLKMLQYSNERGKWQSLSLSNMAEHMFRDGILQIAYQQTPYQILWVVTTDGKAHSLSFNQEAGLVAWSTHETKGSFQSVAVVEGTTGSDEVYFSVKREMGGVDYTLIEKMEFYRLDTWDDCWYVDCGEEWIGSDIDCDSISDSAGEAEIVFKAEGPEVGDVIRFAEDPPGVSGLAVNEYELFSGSGTTFIIKDLDGNSVDVGTGSTGEFTVTEARNWIEMPDIYSVGDSVGYFSDKGAHSGEAVELDGSVKKVIVDEYACTIRAGYEYETTIHTLPVPIAMKEIKRITSVGVFFFESNAGYLKDKHGDLSSEIVMDHDIVLDGALDLWTGVKRMNFLGGRDKYGEIVVQSSKPSPMNIMAITYEVEV